MAPYYESDFWEKIFQKKSEITVFSLFNCTITLLITMPTIKHGSIVNITDFCSWIFLKFGGGADCRMKNKVITLQVVPCPFCNGDQNTKFQNDLITNILWQKVINTTSICSQIFRLLSAFFHFFLKHVIFFGKNS